MRREDGRIDPARIGGPGAAVGDTLVWDGMRWVPGSAAGGGPLGYAVVELTFPNVTADGTNHNPSAVSIVQTEGDPDIDVTSGITFADSNTPCLYIITGLLIMDGTTNVVSSDVTAARMVTPMGTHPLTLVGTADRDATTTTNVQISSSVNGTPWIVADCSGGTNRVYAVDYCALYVVRFPAA